MRTMVILKGLPGSGKSTYAAEMCAENPKRWFRINRDDLRKMAVGQGNNPHSGVHEVVLRKVKEDLIRQAFDAGFDVILDDTHLNPGTVKALHKLASDYNDVKVVEVGFRMSADECIARDSSRTGFAKVGPSVIGKMAKLATESALRDKETVYSRPLAGQQYHANPQLPAAVMCDLDGTLAIIGNRSPYDATDCDLKDKPNPAVVACLSAMARKVDIWADVVFMSGRSAKYRPETKRFIEAAMGNDLWDYELHMRADGDNRKDAEVKLELFNQHVRNKYNVVFVLDDRNQVVDMWRSIGLTCFQVAPGNF